jgi:hypothetical protein
MWLITHIILIRLSLTAPWEPFIWWHRTITPGTPLPCSFFTGREEKRRALEQQHRASFSRLKATLAAINLGLEPIEPELLRKVLILWKGTIQINSGAGGTG